MCRLSSLVPHPRARSIVPLYMFVFWGAAFPYLVPHPGSLCLLASTKGQLHGGPWEDVDVESSGGLFCPTSVILSVAMSVSLCEPSSHGCDRSIFVSLPF